MWRVTVLYTYNLKCYCIWPLLSIHAQQVPVSRANTALNVHGCTAVLKSCYDSLLVIVITRARTAETIYRSCYYPEQKISARKCTYNTYNFKTVKPSFVIASLPATQFRLPSMRWFGCDVSATHVALCPAAPAACVQQPRKLQQHLRRTFLAVWRSFCDTAH